MKNRKVYIRKWVYIQCIYMIRREFDSKVRKVGNSYVITIPSHIVKKLKLKQGKSATVVMKK
jgi:hypothetical protein